MTTITWGCLYLVSAFLSLRLRIADSWRRVLFCFTNLLFFFLIFYGNVGQLHRFAAYVTAIGGCYVLLLCFGRSRSWSFYIALLAPLVLLGIVRGRGFLSFAGISYVAFRISYLALELRRGRIASPSLINYLCFAFFLPTSVMGPISPYQFFQESMGAPQLDSSVIPIAVARIGFGVVKFQFLSHLFSQLTFTALWSDGYQHGIFDFLISGSAYYLYIFCNFSGFCDVVVGTSQLLGIKVKENFDSPLTSRNLRDYWTRWHITLGDYARDIFFTPLSTWAARICPEKFVDIVVWVVLIATFLLIGLWHGLQWNYLLFGLHHGLGICAQQMFSKCLVRWPSLQPPQWIPSRILSLASWFVTFLYISVGCFYFENSLPQMMKVLSTLTWDW